MITERSKDFVLVKFLPRHWKKRDVCRRNNCSKRTVHFHWVATTHRIMKMVVRVWTSPLIDILQAPNSLLSLIQPVQETP